MFNRKLSEEIKFPNCKNLSNNVCVEAMHNWAVAYTKNYIKWYAKNKKWPRRLSRCIRGFSLLLASIGIISPLIDNVLKIEGLNFSQWGYLLIALSASAMLFDKYFGLSSRWVRFISAQLELEHKLNTFMVDWKKAKCYSGDKDNCLNQIELIMKYVVDVGETILDETTKWRKEFENNISELDDLLKSNKNK
jgi:conflict system pore-forming effector with SLATT domain